ncbi:PTS system fructose-specific EIIABC component [bacterium BMS3Abin05]|nr:PTS system fructose-specific EIIABC component [bacterium BMS3Abin05]GBE28814.1 PTS system fructose-specific EIIABC component [bacterium BMS3Bbin03]HDK35470.1 PTS sugar transporter subunit IIA [Bacteroidota bacterium]HDL78014.1 PTS sugar transporter subunit IIA [Bacteroidota bacterium]HDZ11687.1 PTS sugar transporter subunit IIA [Bacteroidota bacterium]
MDFQEFTSYFHPNLFITELKAETKDEALEEIVGVLSEHKGLKDKWLILEMLKRRENLGSTGIGHGIAIPHGRSLSIKEMFVAFARSVDGIPYDSIDDEPVHLIFMIVAPPHEHNQNYLPFLGKLVEILKEEGNREQLAKCENFDQLIDILAGGF